MISELCCGAEELVNTVVALIRRPTRVGRIQLEISTLRSAVRCSRSPLRSSVFERSVRCQIARAPAAHRPPISGRAIRESGYAPNTARRLKCHSLVWIVQEHAVFLSNESREGPGRFMGDWGAEAAAVYAAAASDAFRRFLWRIRIVTERLRGRDRAPDVEIVDVVTAMLADPWVAHMLSREDGP
jgi:hypothetical protein